MNSNALMRLQAEYQSAESDTDEDQELKADAKQNMELDVELDIKSEPESDIKTEVKAEVESIIKMDTKPDIEVKSESTQEVKCMPEYRQSPNNNLNGFVKNDSYHEIDISSDSSSSSWSLSSDESHEETNERKQTKIVVKTKGELSLEDLPPIENLTISVGVEELSQLGRVVSIIDQLVIVQSFRSMPALDLDSVLFFKDGQPLGRIFDVFGPVLEPRYAIRFNDVQQIIDLKISVETPVYFAAEQNKPITGFVFAEQLRRMKGSDASWKHNNEPPEDIVEYSDDESERLHKQKSNAKRSHNQRNCHLRQNTNIFSFLPKQN